jgi:hypothetical protein
MHNWSVRLFRSAYVALGTRINRNWWLMFKDGLRE